MKTLAKATIQAAAFLELSSDDAINPDDAARALEDISATLQSALLDEVTAIRAALQELIAEEHASLAPADVLRFYKHFLDSIGLADKD